MNISFGALPPRTKYITNNIIIGARQNLAGLKQLQQEENISRVIDLRSSCDYKKMFEIINCKTLGLKYQNFPLELMHRKTIQEATFNKIAKILSSNKDEKIFIHCNSGRHRSMFVASLIKFKDGTLKTIDDFQNFLKQNDFYKLRKKVRLGFKFDLTPEDIKLRTENLDYQKEQFWNFLTKNNFS